jgi:hypothetical protein
MLEKQWSVLAQQHQSDGLIWLDSEGDVIQTNPKGQKYLALLADADDGASPTHLGDRPLQELLALPTTPEVQLSHEVNLVGPHCQKFEVVSRPMLAGSRFEGWVLVIRAIPPEGQERPVLIVHWPPVLLANSNMP